MYQSKSFRIIHQNRPGLLIGMQLINTFNYYGKQKMNTQYDSSISIVTNVQYNFTISKVLRLKHIIWIGLGVVQIIIGDGGRQDISLVNFIELWLFYHNAMNVLMLIFTCFCLQHFLSSSLPSAFSPSQNIMGQGGI